MSKRVPNMSKADVAELLHDALQLLSEAVKDEASLDVWERRRWFRLGVAHGGLKFALDPVAGTIAIDRGDGKAIECKPAIPRSGLAVHTPRL